MSVFQCKMCGGILNVAEGSTVVECEYCGNFQTVPKSMDANMQNLCNRANTLRMKGEFDKAAQIYEKIIELDATQSEAYWGLILCKYGIEYVDDPVTLAKIPTCHRASYDSIIADEDYKSAIENADITQKVVYKEQAKEIDRIQKEILALAQNEENYDVFICYKETDADGRRTQDSVIANEIYYQLTNEGFKVFYAAITLEGKLGSAYEPIIFAALNSAKVMLVVGTKPEYFNAVWVKNEWSRFLRIIKRDHSRVLVPCYRDMDPYELPEEFAHLQAQDMSKLGFISDLVRGIKKIIGKDERIYDYSSNETAAVVNTNVAPLIKRIYMFLENEQWVEADIYSEKVLDIEPECQDAYLGKLLAYLKISSKEGLANAEKSFVSNINYINLMRYADDDTKAYLNYCNEKIVANIEQKRIEALYVNAIATMNRGDFFDAAEMFYQISTYRNSAEMAALCKEKEKQKIKNDKEVAYCDRIVEAARISFEKNTITEIDDGIHKLSTIKDYQPARDLLKKEHVILRKNVNDRKTKISKLKKDFSDMEELYKKHKEWKKSTWIALCIAIGVFLFPTFLTLVTNYFSLGTQYFTILLGFGLVIFEIYSIIKSGNCANLFETLSDGGVSVTRKNKLFFETRLENKYNVILAEERYLKNLEYTLSKLEAEIESFVTD